MYGVVGAVVGLVVQAAWRAGHEPLTIDQRQLDLRCSPSVEEKCSSGRCCISNECKGVRAAGHTPGNQPLVCLHSYPKELMPMATPIMAQPMIRTIITITNPAVLNPTENIHLNHDRSRRSGCILASSVGTRPSPGGGTINLSPHRRQNLCSKPTAAPHSGQ